MLAYILRRLLWTPILLLLAAFFVFFMGTVAPGDPAELQLKNRATPERIEKLREPESDVAAPNDCDPTRVTEVATVRRHSCLHRGHRVPASHHDHLIAWFKMRPAVRNCDGVPAFSSNHYGATG